MRATLTTKDSENSERTRIGVMGPDDGEIYLWIGRKDDTEDDERVAILSRAECLRLIKALQKAIERAPSTTDGGGEP